MTWKIFENVTMEREERRYNEYVDSVLKEVTDRLHTHEMILKGGASVFYASEEVTRDEWLAYYQHQGINDLYSGIWGVAFSRIIHFSELENHIEEIRAEGFLDYTVWPEGNRESYVPIVYIEPFNELNKQYLGYDLASIVEIQPIIEKMNDSGEVSISGKLPLTQETDDSIQQGFLMLAPVYRQGMPINSADERRAAIKGYILGTYHIDELMEGIFQDLIHNIDFYIYDGSEVSSEAMMYYTHVTLDTPDNNRTPLFVSQKTLNIYGHRWTLVFETTPSFKAALDYYIPNTILVAGLLISFLIFLYLRTLEAIGDRAYSLAQKMTFTLKESEAKYRFLTENVKDAIWTADLEGHLTYISPSIEHMLGYTPEELFDMPLKKFIVQEDYNAIKAKLTDELSKTSVTKGQSVSVQAQFITKDHQIKHVELNTSWIKDEQGKPIGIQGTTRDITERRQLQEQIIKSRQMYQSVVDTQTELICRYLPDTTITFVNDAFCRTFGKKRSELIGEKYLKFLAPENHEDEVAALKRLSLTYPSDTREFEVKVADGYIRWHEWTDVAIFNEAGELVEIQGTGRDITERILAEQNMIQAYDATIAGWAHALDLRDEKTEEHSRRVTEITMKIAMKMGIKDDELAHIRRGALLHDIGKMGISDKILLKPGKLTDQEWEIMKRHPIFAYEMLSPISFLQPALDIPYCHHEKWDGSGYPRGLKGKQIPIAARIFAVVDVYDALSSKRPYRKAWPKEKVLKYIKEQSGKYFDPEIVELFLQEIENLV